MMTGNDNGEQISKYPYAVRHIFLVRENFSGEWEPQWLDGKHIWGVTAAASWSPLISPISDHIVLLWDNCAFGSI